MSYRVLCYFIVVFLILSLLYFGYMLMQPEYKENSKMSNASIATSRPEKKMNFVLIINTESGQPNRTISKGLSAPTAHVEHPIIPDVIRVGPTNTTKSSQIPSDKKALENLIAHNIFNTRAIFVPHVAEGHKNEWDEASDRAGFENEHKPIIKFNPFFKQQQDTAPDLFQNSNDKKDESSSSTSY